MSKLTVTEAAEYLGITKEAVYNRIRRKTLSCVVENGLKYVMLGSESVSKNPKRKQMIDGSFVEYLLKQVDELKEKNEVLQKENTRLRDEKEKMLIESKIEVENIYKERDERLKYILTLLTQPLALSDKKRILPVIDVEAEDLTPYEREIVTKAQVKKWQNIFEYMDEKKYSERKKAKIYEQLLKILPKSKSLKEESGILYIKRTKSIKEILRKSK